MKWDALNHSTYHLIVIVGKTAYGCVCQKCLNDVSSFKNIGHLPKYLTRTIITTLITGVLFYMENILLVTYTAISIISTFFDVYL